MPLYVVSSVMQHMVDGGDGVTIELVCLVTHSTLGLKLIAYNFEQPLLHSRLFTVCNRC